MGPIKTLTTDRKHIKKEWKKGLFDLKSLIKILKNEAVLFIEDNGNVQVSPSQIRPNNFSGIICIRHRTDTPINIWLLPAAK